jgi:hypothetical protein
MNVCSVCGNHYDKLLEVVYLGKRHFYDCFECAIHQLAPRCTHCGIRVIGHGVEIDQGIYCSAHCSRSLGKQGAVDRSPAPFLSNLAES